MALFVTLFLFFSPCLGILLPPILIFLSSSLLFLLLHLLFHLHLHLHLFLHLFLLLLLLLYLHILLLYFIPCSCSFHPLFMRSASASARS